LRRHLDLDAKHPLRGIRVEVPWESPATGADVWEESEGIDVCEGVGEWEDVAANRYWCSILLLRLPMMVVVELIDVKDDLVWAFGRNGRNDEMAVIEEGENGVVMATYSNRLYAQDQGSLIKCVHEIKSTIFT